MILVKNNLNYAATNNFCLFLFRFYCIVLFESVFAWLLHFHLHHISCNISDRNLYLPNLATLFTPKPSVLFVFYPCLLSLPFVTYFSLKINSHAKIFENYLFYCFMIVFTTFLFTFPFFHSSFAQMTFNPVKIISLKHTIFCFALTFLVVYLLKMPLKLPNFLKKLFCLLMLGLIIFIYSSTIIQSVYSVIPPPAYNYWNDFNIVFYSIGQIFAGKTVLANFASQYGLYAELLKPIFMLVGLSILKATIVFYVLQVVTMAVIFLSLCKVFKNDLLIFLCMLTLCMIVGMIHAFVNYDALVPYLQYYPLRMLFPALFILVSTKICKNIDKKDVFLISLLSAAGVIWNLDSGVPVIITFLIYLMSFFIFPRGSISRWLALKFIGLFIFMVMLLVGSFLIYLQMKTPLPIHWIWWIKAQLIFGKGFMSLPFPLYIHPWLIIFSLYIFGLLGALQHWSKGLNRPFWNFSFILSILGYGVFIYYSGRSHDLVLIAVSWVSIIYVFLFMDRIFQLIQLKFLPKVTLVIAIPMICASIFISTSLFHGLPNLYHLLRSHIADMQLKPRTPIILDLEFMKKCLHGRKEATIISLYQEALYFGELNIASSITTSSSDEMNMKSDQINILKQLETNHLKDVFVTLEQGNIPEPYHSALKHYNLVATSPTKDLVYLTWKP